MYIQEYVDLVNEEDTVIKSHVPIEEAYKQDTYIIRSAQLLIRNSEWKLWIPRRTLHKKKFPGALDFSAGGHTQSGENYVETIVREAMEEINLKLDPEKLTCIYSYRWEKDAITGVGFHGNVYEYESGEEPVMNPADFSEARWMTPTELKKKLLDPTEPVMKWGFLTAVEWHYLKWSL